MDVLTQVLSTFILLVDTAPQYTIDWGNLLFLNTVRGLSSSTRGPTPHVYILAHSEPCSLRLIHLRLHFSYVSVQHFKAQHYLLFSTTTQDQTYQ